MASSSRRQEINAPNLDGDGDVKRKRCVLDFDTLDCPICIEPLAAPVYQCPNGHIVCGECCKKLTTGLCPSCSLPIGNRCIAVEKIIESLQVQCKYAVFGCKNMMQYTNQERHDHEGVCEFRPFVCPCVGCSLEVPKSDLFDHFRNYHGGGLLCYQKPNEDDPFDEVRNSFTLSTDDGECDRSNSKYVIVFVSGDSDCEEQDSEDQVFLIHNQFHEKECRYSFSLTSFGTQCFDYRLSVSVERDRQWLVGRSNRTFKGYHSIEGPIYDNQTDKTILRKVVRQGECLLLPRLSASQRDTSNFEVDFQIVAHRYL